MAGDGGIGSTGGIGDGSGFGSLFSNLGGLSGPVTPSGMASKPGDNAINSGLQIASMVPGPQQPFVAAASQLAPMVEGIFGGGGKAPDPAPAPPLPMARPGQMQMQPITSPSAAPSGNLVGGGMGISGGGVQLPPAIMALLQRMTGGGLG